MARCQRTSTGKEPLFPGISVPMSEAHLARGAYAASQVEKINGKCVILFVGLSNFKQETHAIMRMVRAAGIRHILFHNGCRSGWDLRESVSFADKYWLWIKDGLTKRNITANQVQVLFLKNTERGGSENGSYEMLLERLLVRAMREFPNLKQIFITSATYSGYVNDTSVRTEPQAWLEGKAVDNVIKAHEGDSGLPWIGWSAYLWADGIIPRKDGLTWECSDFEHDGIHPGPEGEVKVARMFRTFLNHSPVTSWYRGL